MHPRGSISLELSPYFKELIFVHLTCRGETGGCFGAFLPYSSQEGGSYEWLLGWSMQGPSSEAAEDKPR